MRKTQVMIGSLCVFLVGCASTGVVPIGEGRYQIAKTSPACGFRTAYGTEADIDREANDYCQSQGLEFSTVYMDGQDGIIGRRCASAQLTFRCVNPSVPPSQEQLISDQEFIQQLEQNRQANGKDIEAEPAMLPQPTIIVPPPVYNPPQIYHQPIYEPPPVIPQQVYVPPPPVYNHTTCTSVVVGGVLTTNCQ